MKIAVLGANGMLGSMLTDYLSRYFEVTPVTRLELDATNFTGNQLGAIMESHDWIINAVGVIPQRYDNTENKLMYQVNTMFPHDLAAYRKPVIQIGTDCIFSGTKGKYCETDEGDSKDDYGISKARLGYEVLQQGIMEQGRKYIDLKLI